MKRAANPEPRSPAAAADRGGIDALRPVTAAIARDAPPVELLTLALQSIAALAGGTCAVLLVRPARIARACGVEISTAGPMLLAPRAALVLQGDLADVVRRYEGGVAQVTEDRHLVLPLPAGGICVVEPDAGALDDRGRAAALEALAELAGGALHAARRLDEAHQRARALETARTRLHEQNALLQELAVIDDLTGVHNRRSLHQRLDNEISRFQRYGRPLALCLFDVDHFKQVNDRWGHQVGDRVLKHIAEQALAAARRVDLVARYGGDEFAILMPETDAAGGNVVAERLRAAIERLPVETDAGPVRVTSSLGVVGAVQGWKGDGDALIKRADEALYEAKGAGRNRVVTRTT